MHAADRPQFQVEPWRGLPGSCGTTWRANRGWRVCGSRCRSQWEAKSAAASVAETRVNIEPDAAVRISRASCMVMSD